MGIFETVKSLAVRRGPSLSPDVPPPGAEASTTREQVQVQVVREHISTVSEARNSHWLVVAQRDDAARELAETVQHLGVVQTQLADREKQIAAAGGELPEEPFPEDAEVALLTRHVRIRRESVNIWDGRVRESQAFLNSQIQELDSAWVELGAQISRGLAARFRAGATEMRNAQLEYRALMTHFCQAWNSKAWKYANKDLAILDPERHEALLHPHDWLVQTRWPASALELLKSVDGLRAEVDAAVGRKTESVAQLGTDDLDEDEQGEHTDLQPDPDTQEGTDGPANAGDEG